MSENGYFPHPQYTSKTYRSVNRSIVSSQDAELMGEMVGRELDMSIKHLSKIMPKLKLCIEPVLSVANENQNVIGDSGIKEMECSNSGGWNCSVCLSYQTEQLHTENDFTFTVINTPA